MRLLPLVDDDDDACFRPVVATLKAARMMA